MFIQFLFLKETRYHTSFNKTAAIKHSEALVSACESFFNLQTKPNISRGVDGKPRVLKLEADSGVSGAHVGKTAGLPGVTP